MKRSLNDGSRCIPRAASIVLIGVQNTYASCLKFRVETMANFPLGKVYFGVFTFCF